MKTRKQIFTLKDASGADQRYTVDQSGQLIPLVEDKEPVIKTVYSPDEARKILGVSRNSFMNLLYSGQLKGVKAGRRWLIPLHAIHSFLGQPN